MKSNFLKLSYFAIAATGLLSACNQENISSDVVNPDKTLTISVNPSDFIPVDAESRAVTADDLSSTTFENGDELGLFVISTNDDMVYYDNVKFTYNNGTWTPEKEVYYYRYSKYVAYYPYSAELSLEDKTAAGITESIKSAFATTNIPADQSTADAFEKADLLLAEGVEKEGKVTFDLEHQFSLVEIKIPVKKYQTSRKYGNPGKEFTYNAPLELSWYQDLTLDRKITPFNAGKGVLRYIFNPESESSNSIVINGNVKYDDIPYNFGQETAYTLELTAGQYKRFIVTIPDIDNAEPEVRDLEVGDYYYSDGSIYPYGNQSENDKSNPVKDGCIGVIYDVVNANDTDGTNSWNHGYVLALSSAGTSKWGGATVSDNIHAWNDVLDDDKNQYTAAEMEVFDEILSRYDGYESSIRLLSSTGTKEALVTAMSYSKQAPGVISSGWYLPSIGQIYLMMKNLGELNFEGNYKKLSHLFYGQRRSSNETNAAMNKINDSLKKIDESYSISDEIWKSVTEVDAYNSWVIEWKNDNIRLFSRIKTQNDEVRPVLSF